MQLQYLTDFLEANAKRWPEQPAIIFEGASLSWRQLWRTVNQVAAALEDQLGDRSAGGPAYRSDRQLIIGLLMPNSIDYVVANLAIVHLGHIALPIDIIFKSLEIDAVIDQMSLALVLTDSVNRPRITTEKVPALTVDELADGGRPKNLLRLPADKQIASLLFTSGTTGRPKAVPYTHSMHAWNIKVCSQAWGWTHDDGLLVSLRLSHMHGLVMGLSGALYHGNTLYLQERFDEAKTLEALASGRISIFSHGPAVYIRLLQAPKAASYDLSRVRLFISGSAPLSPETWREFKRTFGAEILEVYGSSETGRIASNLPDERLPGSPGRPLPEVKIKFSTHSEVLVKSPGVFPGYFNDPDATAAATAPGGWWKTGDIGRLENGRLVLKGRLSERIRRFGYDVSPRDVEWVLHKHPAIKEAIVVGIRRAGSADDELFYFLSADCSEAEVREFCKTNMPSIWRPDRIIFLEQIPRNRSGKPHLVKMKAMID